jgi:hypothetical protein
MKHFCVVFFCFLLILSSSTAFAAEKKAQLIFPEITVLPGKEFKLPIMLDNVPNLAGIKLALTYDKNVLTYTKSEKTKTTASLMHIVNDKNPGKLVIVMAGARGVSVNKQSVMDLYFKVNTQVPKAIDMTFKIIDIQLMSDTLKELAYEFNISPVHVKASPVSPVSKNKKEVSLKTITPPNISKTSLSEPQKITPKNSPKKSVSEQKKINPPPPPKK